MVVRLRRVQRTAPDRFRLTLDLVDPEHRDWTEGDCVLRVDLLDAPSHQAIARGPLAAALDLYHLTRDTPPSSADSRLLWEMGRAIDAFISRVFAARILCPCTAPAEDGAQDRAE